MSSLPPAGDPVSEGAPAPRPPAQVLCRVRPGVTLAFELKSDEAVVGRDSGLAATIPLEGVSRQHARILWDGLAYWLEDLKSTNGTLLNGQRIVRDRLRHLDVITLGKKADLVFVLRSAPAGLVRQQGIVRAALVAESDGTPHEIAVGEATLGRSSACNVVDESGAVSKVHARIERTADQLILQDLVSSNGTYVNGERVMTALLRDGDRILLGGVESFRVQVEMGEISSGSGIRRRAAVLAPPGEEGPQFSADWKTRFEWDSAELQAIANLHEDVAEKLGLAGKGSTQKQPAVKPPPAKVTGSPSRPTPAKTPPSPAAVKPAPAAAPAAIPANDAAPLAEVRLTGADEVLVASSPGRHVLGRSADAPLRVKHPTVSRTHARIVIADDRQTAFLEHAGGANGTRLNGRPIDKAQALADGDEIGIGQVTLRVSLKRT